MFPPRSLRAQTDQPIIIDPWAAPRNYAEDFYAGGDSLNIPAGVSPEVAAHLLGGDIDETPFLTPGVVTPLEANASPYSPPREVTYNDDEIQEIVPPVQGEMPSFNFPLDLEGFEDANIDPTLRDSTPQTSTVGMDMAVGQFAPI